jgi:S-adenosylmethionine/arginine decarboxylase-like enzyme
LHAWPEFGFVAIDAFTCGVEADPGLICRDIAELIDTKECDIALMVRGPSDSQSMDVRNI